MDKLSLSNVSTLNVLVELLYRGKATIIPELLSTEPFEVSDLLRELRRRSSVDLGDSVEAWCEWFMSPASEVTQRDRETFRLLKKFKDEHDRFADRHRDAQ